MKIATIGNCQGHNLSRIFEMICPGVASKFFSVVTMRDAAARATIVEEISEYDVIFTLPIEGPMYGAFTHNDLAEKQKVILYPTISFTGYHPDCGYLNLGKLKSPIGDYHSLIAVAAYLNGATVEAAQRLYSTDVYEQLGYLRRFELEIQRLKAVFAKFDLGSGDAVSKTFYQKKMMHTVNHPRLAVLDFLAKDLLVKGGINYRHIDSSEYLSDMFPDSTVFPVYPGLVDGIEGAFAFKPALKPVAPFAMLDLSEFLALSFDLYSKANPADIVNPELARTVEVIGGILKHPEKSAKKNHPYLGLPDYCFWKRSFALPISDFDPVIKSDFRIKTQDKIATAGSCFAQHLAKRLSKSGFNYYVPEAAPKGASEKVIRDGNFGVFSCRYANIYTVRQLDQLLARAYGQFDDQIGYWNGPKGCVVDPYRPQIQAGGFLSIEAAAKDRKIHLESVKRMFEELDYFVFTMGLTEGWLHKPSGAVLPVAPGVAGGHFDPNVYEFQNFNYEEVLQDLQSFLNRLKEINPTAQVILTVSPVPLAATYEDRHVLVSTAASKAILRAVAEKISKAEPSVHYFPSFEIITGNYTASKYFEADLREIRPEGVDHVMRLFEKHCTQKDAQQVIVVESDNENSYLDTIVCEEDLLNL